MDISVNPIISIPAIKSDSPRVFRRLQELVIKETLLDDWENLGNLATWFEHDPTALESLKISPRIEEEGVRSEDGHNRQRLSGTRADRAALVARFKGLKELNSSPVSIRSSIRVYCDVHPVLKCPEALR